MKLISVLLTVFFSYSVLTAALIHRYDFNDNLADDFSGPALIPVHTDTSGYDSGT